MSPAPRFSVITPVYRPPASVQIVDHVGADGIPLPAPPGGDLWAVDADSEALLLAMAGGGARRLGHVQPVSLSVSDDRKVLALANGGRVNLIRTSDGARLMAVVALLSR